MSGSPPFRLQLTGYALYDAPKPTTGAIPSAPAADGLYLLRVVGGVASWVEVQATDVTFKSVTAKGGPTNGFKLTDDANLPYALAHLDSSAAPTKVIFGSDDPAGLASLFSGGQDATLRSENGDVVIDGFGSGVAKFKGTSAQLVNTGANSPSLIWTDSGGSTEVQRIGNVFRIDAPLVSLRNQITISEGAGVPAAAEADGSLYLRNDAPSPSTAVYSRQGGAWNPITVP